jgi:hypothetical protein
MWQAEPLAVRESYKAKSEQMKAEHLEKHPGYTYQPRKPSEKKRRNTKNKIAKSKKRAKTQSHLVTIEYNRMPQETGSLEGDIFAVHDATLPLSATTVEEIEEHNYIHRDPNATAESRTAPVNVAPSAGYAAVAHADEVALDLSFDPDFAKNSLGLGEEYEPLDRLNQWELSAEFVSGEWTWDL